MAVLDLLPLPKKKKKAPKGFAAPPINVPRYQPPLIPSQSPVPPRLKKKLVALGRRYRIVNISERLAQLLTYAVLLVTVQMFLDWLVNLNILVRFVFLAGDIWLIVLFTRKHLLKLILHAPNLEACALMVEKKWKGLRGRLIATVQFAGPRFTSDSPELVRTVQQDTDAKTGALNFSDIVPIKPLKRRTTAAIAVLSVWLCGMYLFAPGTISLLERVFLIPAKVPRKTEVICLSGDKIIPAGESVLLEAQAKGIVPSHGRVTIEDNDGKLREITMDPEPDQYDHFALKVDKVDQPFSYTITLNDGTSDTYRVKTIPRPNVTAIDCTQVYPPYTGLPDAKRTVGNLALLAGSQLKIHATTNSKIVKASIKLIGLDKTIPLTLDPANGNDLTGSFSVPPTGLTGFSIQLTNEANITSGDETQYRIDLIPDHPPTSDLTYPERLQELYTLKAKPWIAFSATDDYGLAKIALCYRIVQDQSNTPAATDATAGNIDTTSTPAAAVPVNRIEMDIGQGHPLSMKNRYQWDLAAIKPTLSEGTTLEYWIEAQDANNVTGPGITESEHHTIKLVTDIEKRAEVMNRLMDSLSTITDISHNQEKVNDDLGQVIQGKSTTSTTNAPAANAPATPDKNNPSK